MPTAPRVCLARGVGQGSFRGRIAYQPLPAKARLSTELVATGYQQVTGMVVWCPTGPKSQIWVSHEKYKTKGEINTYPSSFVDPDALL